MEISEEDILELEMAEEMIYNYCGKFTLLGICKFAIENKEKFTEDELRSIFLSWASDLDQESCDNALNIVNLYNILKNSAFDLI